MKIAEMTVEELKARRDQGDAVYLLDVRNQNEWDFCRLDGATLMPMNEVPTRLAELDRDREIVVMCRSGGRSARVVAFLQQHGFTKLWNLEGGILAWADRIDPTVPKY